MYSSRYLNDDDDLKKILNLFIDHLLKLRPDLKAEMTGDKREKIVNTLVQVLRNQKPNLSTRDLADPEFVKQLSCAVVTAMTLHKLELGKKNLFDQLKLIFDPKSKQNQLTPQEQKKFQESLQQCCANILKELEQAQLMKPKPPSGKKLNEEMAKEMDRYENLFGLVSSYTTGGIASVVQCFMGNGLGFTDWNPNQGIAQIDTQNKPNNTLSGDDSQALNAGKIGRYLQYSGESFINSFISELRSEGLAASSTPSPSITSPRG